MLPGAVYSPSPILTIRINEWVRPTLQYNVPLDLEGQILALETPFGKHQTYPPRVKSGG